jgi:hypothetical protein
METMIWKRLGLIALMLALPLVVFVGETGRTVVNGEVVGEYQVNYAGVLLAVIGFVLAVGAAVRRTVSVREDAPPTPGWARGVAAVLALAGAVQIVVQAGFIAS